MERFKADVELNDDFQPVGKGVEIFDRLLPYLVGIAFYLLLLDLSLLLINVLGKSPIVILLSALVGFIAVIAGWIVAILLFGLLGGNFSFAKSVFFLFDDVYFRAGIFVLFMGVFIARAFVGVTARASFSYSAKMKIFLILIVSILISFGLLCGFLDKISDNPGRYYFMFLLLYVIYSFATGHGNRENHRENHADQFRFPSEDKKNKQEEKYSWEELNRIFRNL